MPLRVVTPPSVEPVTVSNAKLYAAVDGDDNDLMLSVFISSARSQGENITRRSWVPQTLELNLDAFPASGKPIELPRPPITSVLSVSYVNPAGETEDMGEDDYTLKTVSDHVPPKLYPASGSWPETDGSDGCVSIGYQAGWTVASNGAPSTPKELQLWVMAKVATHIENREEITSGANVSRLPGRFIDRLLDPWIVPELS